MKKQILEFMANEGMSFESMRKFEAMYGESIDAATRMEIFNSMKKAEEEANKDKINVGELAAQANIRQ